MPCTDDELAHLNRTIEGSDHALPTLTVEYSAYMNWGRWNHNTSRIDFLIQMLNEDLGYTVKLLHDPEETTWENHGWVKVSLGGKVVAESANAQHNRSYSTRQETMESMIAAVVAAGAMTEAAGSEEAEVDQSSPSVNTAADAADTGALPVDPSAGTCVLPSKPKRVDSGDALVATNSG